MIPDHNTVMLIHNLKRLSPGAVELATYASIAVRIESELLRALRLQLAPHLDVGCEADLWHSRLVLASGPSGITLRPGVAQLLRCYLRDDVDPAVAKRAWNIIRRVHADTSPAIFLEEYLAWSMIQGSYTDIEIGLKRALKTMVDEPKRGLASWWMRARDRLPAEVRSSMVVGTLERVAASQLATVSPEKALKTDFGHRQAMLVDKDTTILVRRSRRTLELGEFEPDTATHSIKVPAQEPVLIEVKWKKGRESTIVSLSFGQSHVLLIGEGPVQLKNERGIVYELPDTKTSADPVELIPLSDLLQSVVKACARGFGGAAKSYGKSFRQASNMISTSIGEYVDPAWRRALRLLKGQLPSLPPNPELSEFVRACIDLSIQQSSNKRLVKRLGKLGRKLEGHLAAYDKWDPAYGTSRDLASYETQELITKVDRIFQQLAPNHPRMRLANWISAYIQPEWHDIYRKLTHRERWHDPQPRIGEFVALLVEKTVETIGELADSSKSHRYTNPIPVKRDTLDFLRRHRPDLDFDLEPASEGFRLVGEWKQFLELAMWAGIRIASALEALEDQRRARRDGIDRPGVPTTIIVASDGSGDFKSIRKAVDAAGHGATIRVKGGVYRENVALKKGMSLLAEGKDEVVIDGGGHGWVIRAADDCRIAGLTIRGSGDTTGVNDCGVMVERCEGCSVEDNRIINNGHYGIILRNCRAKIVNNLIAQNAILGIYIDNGAEFEIGYNQFLQHRHSALDICGSEPRGAFHNNHVISCGDAISQQYELDKPLKFSIINNIFWSNQVAISAPAEFAKEIGWNLFHKNKKDYFDWNTNQKIELASTNVFADPKFVNPKGEDYRLRESSPARKRGKNGEDIGALPFESESPSTDNMTNISILLWYEGDLGELPQRLRSRLVNSGIKNVTLEPWSLAKEKGDPSLSSFAGGNSIHYHEDETLRAEELQQVLHNECKLKLVPHLENAEISPGSTWSFDRNQFYIFLLEPSAQWNAIVVGVEAHESLPALYDPHSDARLVSQWLTDPRRGGLASESVITLLSPSSSDLFGTLAVKFRRSPNGAESKTFGDVNHPPSQSLFFYYGGHVATEKGMTSLVLADSGIENQVSVDRLFRLILFETGVLNLVLVLDSSMDQKQTDLYEKWLRSLEVRRVNILAIFGRYGAEAGRLSRTLLQGLEGAAATSGGRVTAASLKQFMLKTLGDEVLITLVGEEDFVLPGVPRQTTSS